MALRVWRYKQREAVSPMIHLGDRLGLYRALHDIRRRRTSAVGAGVRVSLRWPVGAVPCV
jgi:hypothetical protein